MLFLAVQNDRYLILTAQLYDTKEVAAEAKTKGDKASQRMAQDRVRVIQQGAGARLHFYYICNIYAYTLIEKEIQEIRIAPQRNHNNQQMKLCYSVNIFPILT